MVAVGSLTVEVTVWKTATVAVVRAEDPLEATAKMPTPIATMTESITSAIVLLSSAALSDMPNECLKVVPTK